MKSFANSLRVDKIKVNTGSDQSVDSLGLIGALAVENTDVLLSQQEVTITWGNQTFVLAQDSFTEPGRGKRYTCSKVADQNGNGIISALLDLDKCVFKIVIKGADISDQGDETSFGITFGNYNESYPLTMQEVQEDSGNYVYP